jgi:hypothetical protein
MNLHETRYEHHVTRDHSQSPGIPICLLCKLLRWQQHQHHLMYDTEILCGKSYLNDTHLLNGEHIKSVLSFLFDGNK